MVMPSIPIFFRASLTSSSLKGWTIASIFFISILFSSPGTFLSTLQNVPFFAVLRQVEPLRFVIPAHANAERGVTDLQDQKCSHGREDDRHDDAYRLIEDLFRIAVDQAKGNPKQI